VFIAPQSCLARAGRPLACFEMITIEEDIEVAPP
jgi:hypothetical protein